jgi:hypothetical protein
MDDKITKDLIKDSDKLYKELIELFDKNALTDQLEYIKFLFNDIIIYDPTSLNKYIEISKNINECIPFFDSYNEKIKLKYGSNDLFLNKIKEIIQERNKSILKKIVECDEHIEIIKKYYIKLFFSSNFIDNNKSELIFKNKTVLTLGNDVNNQKLGEIFSRYIFYLIYERNKAVLDNPNINYWYNNANVSGRDLFSANNILYQHFIPIPPLAGAPGVAPANQWRYNEKYFILIIFLINLLFNSNSNYIDIFNEDKIKLNIKELKKVDKPKNNTKKVQVQKLKHKGGNKKPKQNAITAIISPSSKNKKTEKIGNNNSSNLKKKIKDCIKNIPELNTKCELFKNNSITIFKAIINRRDCDDPAAVPPQTFPISRDIPSIFGFKTINLKNFYNDIINSTTKREIHDCPCNRINSLFNNEFKFDIFQTLLVFDEQQNIKDLTDQIPNLKKKVISLLYSLYSKKKTLYKEYLNSCDRIFQIKSKENNKQSQQKNQEQLNKEKKNQEKLNQERLNKEKKNQEKQRIYIENKIKKNKKIEEKKDLIFIKKLNSQQKTEFIKIKNTLNVLTKKIKKLDEIGQNDIKNDMKKLKLEKKFHNLIIKKLKISKNV